MEDLRKVAPSLRYLHLKMYKKILGDKVSIKDTIPDRKKDVRTGRTFFGLVKLTADWI